MRFGGDWFLSFLKNPSCEGRNIILICSRKCPLKVFKGRGKKREREKEKKA